MAEKCLKCFRPLVTCYCKYIIPVETGAKFVFLMHPKEAYRQHTGTGRLAALSLPDSEIIIGIDFTDNNRLNRLLVDSSFYPVVLYPAPDALTPSSPCLKQKLGDGRRLLVVVIDATWFFAKKMLRLSPNVRSLPALSFSGCYRSEFTFKRQPAAGCVSTIESCYYLIKELQQAEIVDGTVNPEPLMDVFRKMVDFQLDAERQRVISGIPGRHAYDAERDAARLQSGKFLSRTPAP